MKATQRHNDEAMELLRVEAQMLKVFFGDSGHYVEYDRIVTFSIAESVELWSTGVQCPAPIDMSRLDAEDIDHI